MEFRVVGAMAPAQPPLAPEVKLGGGDGGGRGRALEPMRPVAGFDRGELRGGKRKRRERQPNWETSEMFALVKAKKAEHDEHTMPGGDVVRGGNAERGGDLVHKWPKIAASVWNEGASVVFRNSESCKDKWGQLQGEYKKIRDYEKGRLAAGDQRAYWDLRSAERQELHLPKTFHSKRLYERMDEFLNDNPPPTPQPNAFHPNAALREHTGDHAAVSRSHPSDTPENITEPSNLALVCRLHPKEVIAAQVAANVTREVRPPSAHRSHPASTTQRQKRVDETEVVTTIRDRLARLRERILASEDGSRDTERISAGEAASPETEAAGTKDGAVLLKWGNATGKQYECIQAAVVGDGTVGLITLNRPAALNALSHALMLELADALQALDATKQVGAIVLTGKGEAFSAGIDIKEMKETTLVDAFAAPFARHLNAVTAIRKPIIAAVNGYAVAGGGELAMMCDIVLAGERAQFGQPEINLGTIPGMGGSQRLIREVGKSRAMEMILTGKYFMNAHEAARRGLVSRVVPGDDEMLVAEAISLGREIAHKSKPVVALAKETVNTAYEMGLTEGVKKEQFLFYATFGFEDRKEGMTAFLEKRSAVFKDR